MGVEKEGPYQLVATYSRLGDNRYVANGFVHLGDETKVLKQVKVAGEFVDSTKATAAGISAARRVAKQMIESDGAMD